jgi:long-chain fatty acid transport protein
MPNPRRLGWQLGIWLGSAALAPGTATASGFQVRAGSPDWMANAFAGMAAKGYDASTAWTNPAAMSLLSDSQVSNSLNAIVPVTRFSGENLVSGIATSGNAGGNAAIAAAVPGLAGVWSAAPNVKFGFSVEVPFGQRLQYHSGFVGRYQSFVSSVADTELGLAAAYRIDEHLSIGGGPIVDYFHARLSNAINIGPTAALTGDPGANIHAHNWSAGYHLGTLYEFGSGLRTGVDYRSRIMEHLDGGQDISIPPTLAALSPATARLLAAGNTTVHTSVTLPDVLTLSGVWDLTPEWSGLVTLQWTHWSLLKQLSIVGDNGQTTTLPLRLRSTWLGSVGANYRPAAMPNLMLQAGIGFDESAVTDNTRSPRLPGRDTLILGLGFTYEIQPNASIQTAFLHDFGVGPDRINYSANATAGVLTGSYTTSASVIAVGVNWRF